MRAVRSVSSYRFAYSNKKSSVAVLIFNGLILRVHMNHLDALPQLRHAFKHLLNLGVRGGLSLRTSMVKTGQIRCCPHTITLGDM